MGAAAPQHAAGQQGQAVGRGLRQLIRRYRVKIGVIGAGGIGQAFAAHAVKAGYEVILSNSRGAQSLAEAVKHTRTRDQARTRGETALGGGGPRALGVVDAY